jgi:hypothetical protein
VNASCILLHLLVFAAQSAAKNNKLWSGLAVLQGKKSFERRFFRIL